MTKTKKRKRDNYPYFTILDLLITVFSYFLAYFLTNLISRDYFVFTDDYIIMLLLVIPTWAVLIQTSNLTQIPRIRSYTSIFFNFVNFSSLGFILMLLYKHIFSLKIFSHYFIISFTLVNLVSLYIFRMITYKVFKYYRAHGHNIHNVIIFANEHSESFIDALLSHKEWGFRILMILSDSTLIRKKYGETIRIYPDKINIKNLLDIDIIDEVIYCQTAIDEKKLSNLMDVCKEIGVIFRLQSDMPAMAGNNNDGHITHIENMPFLTFKNSPSNTLALTWKSFTEFWVSFTVIFLLSPLMIIITLLVKFTSKGPVIFKQERVGLRGRKFYIYKYRTMVDRAEELKADLMADNESDGPAFKIKNDPRITKIGKILRQTGLDELPQLFNVLKGEMSLIGPRPPLPAEVEKYERWHLKRLSVKPGITCTWQIIPNRNEVLFDNWMKLDINYIENWSIKRDLLLFFKTIKTVIYRTGY